MSGNIQYQYAVSALPLAVASKSEDDFLCINVCGMRYETLRSTLERYPNTLLGNEALRRNFYIPSKDAYFFDRNRQCFEAVLYYYQTKGTLFL